MATTNGDVLRWTDAQGRIDVDRVKTGQPPSADRDRILDALLEEVAFLRKAKATQAVPPVGPIDDSPEAQQAAREAWPLHRSHIAFGARMLRLRVEHLERLTLGNIDPGGYRSGSPMVTAHRIAEDIAEEAARMVGHLTEPVDPELLESARIETAGQAARAALERATRASRGEAR